MPKVSVIIPSYNRAHLLNRAISSVLKQSFQDFELIVVDDASTDNTEQLVGNFNDDRIFYIRHNINKGGSAARNTGIKHARGEFIAFLDSDDEWLPEKIEKQLNVFKNAPLKMGLVYSGFIDEMQEGKHYIPNYQGDYSQVIFLKNLIGTTSSPLIRKECFALAGHFDEKLPAVQDWDMWIRIAQYYKISFAPEVLVKYYSQQDSITLDNQKVLAGYNIILHKYQAQVKNLSRSLRSEYYFFMGKRYFKKRSLLYSLRHFIKSFFVSPQVFLLKGIIFHRKTWC